MPPTRRQPVQAARGAIASAYLTHQFWEMKKRLQQQETPDGQQTNVADDHQCPVCLESVMACRQCFCLLACGHAMHTSCFLQLREAVCPVCRAE